MSRDNLMWFFTVAGFVLGISTAFFQLYQSFGNDPEVIQLTEYLRQSFSHFGVIFSYVIWLVFATIYVILARYEVVWGKRPKRNDSTIAASNYYGTLWVWGIPAILIYHATYITGTVYPIPYIGGTIISNILSVLIGGWGLWLVIEGRIAIDGYWTNHIHKYDDQKIIQSRVYSKVRHPIYGGQCWMVLATFIACNNIWLAFFPIMTLIYNIIRANKEEKVLNRLTHGNYEGYSDKVHRFMLYPFW